MGSVTSPTPASPSPFCYDADMTEPQPKTLKQLMQELSGETEMERRIRYFAAFVELNKTRRRRGGNPPAALPCPVEPRGGGPLLKGGAAAALVFQDR